jgi:hypothetical protein
MNDVREAERCLNCDAPLHGSFCSGCGQRAVPPNPTVRELAGEAWHELTGYDGRIMATIRGLVRPGFLTQEYVNGRRAHYLPPVRVYLIVSVIYFVIAAAAPNLDRERELVEVADSGGIRVSMAGSVGNLEMTEDERRELLAQAERSPWYIKPLLQAVAQDPDAFRARVFTIMPRVFFGLVPVFAAIVHLFYRRRHFPTSLVFALHIHVFAFAIFSVSEAMKFTRMELLAAAVGVIMLVWLVTYALRSLRAVFGGSWPATLARATGIAIAYAIAALPAFALILVWASFT